MLVQSTIQNLNRVLMRRENFLGWLRSAHFTRTSTLRDENAIAMYKYSTNDGSPLRLGKRARGRACVDGGRVGSRLAGVRPCGRLFYPSVRERRTASVPRRYSRGFEEVPRALYNWSGITNPYAPYFSLLDEESRNMLVSIRLLYAHQDYIHKCV